jgi:hypothetical protein
MINVILDMSGMYGNYKNNNSNNYNIATRPQKKTNDSSLP